MKIAVLDIGGTSIKSGVIENETLQEKIETPVNASLGGASLMETAKKIIACYPGFDRIGISTAGQVDSEKGIIRYANQNIPGYTGMRVKEIFEDAFSVPVIVENDVNAAAIGEAVYGAGQEASTALKQDFLCLTFGAGIGGAIVIDGKVYKGASFSAGEVGHIITHGRVAFDGASDGAPGGGENGYYEKYASTAALVKNVQTVFPKLDDGRKIFLNLGQSAVRKIVDAWIDEVLYGLASLIHIFNPSLVVLGGGIMEEGYVIESLQQRIGRHIMPSFREVVLARAALGNDAGLWGAGYLARIKPH